MADRVRGIPAIAKQIIECFVASDFLVLAKGRQQVGESLLWDIELTDRSRQSHKYRMPGFPYIAGVQLGLPFVEQLQRSFAIASLVTQVVRNSAIGVNIVKMLAQALWKQPRRYRKIFVMGACQPFAIRVRIME